MDMREVEINFGNGFKVILWKEHYRGTEEIRIGISNQNGFVITDRKFSEDEKNILKTYFKVIE